MFVFDQTELKNVSRWVDWHQFATVVDQEGQELSPEEVDALPGMSVRIICTPGGNICGGHWGI